MNAQVTGHPPSTNGVGRGNVGRDEFVRDLVAFLGTVAAVMFFDWKAKDVIWGLWICSLTFGYTFIVVTIAASAVHAKGHERVGYALGGLFLLGFFTVHFGMFHLVHGMFLNSFFPLVSEGGFGGFGPGIVLTLIGAALANYWPMVLATFLSRFSDLPLKARVLQLNGKQGKNLLMTPYANVVRMHLLIFVFAGLHAAKMSDLAVYPVLLFYFFPWSTFFGRKSKG